MKHQPREATFVRFCLAIRRDSSKNECGKKDGCRIREADLQKGGDDNAKEILFSIQCLQLFQLQCTLKTSLKMDP